MPRHSSLALFSALLFAPIGVMAQAAPVTPGVSTGGMLKVLLALAAVVGLIYLLAWLLRRSLSRSTGSAQAIKVLASASVGSRERVVLVDVAGRQLLLGVAPGRVNLLSEFEESVVDPEALVGQDFSALLDRLQGSGGGQQ